MFTVPLKAMTGDPVDICKAKTEAEKAERGGVLIPSTSPSAPLDVIEPEKGKIRKLFKTSR
jgi:hypothetical protein